MSGIGVEFDGWRTLAQDFYYFGCSYAGDSRIEADEQMRDVVCNLGHDRFSRYGRDSLDRMPLVPPAAGAEPSGVLWPRASQSWLPG